MADNVAITAGTGTTIATDDAGGAQYQKVKLVDGTADSTTVIPGGANGLKVDLTSTGANTNKILVTPDLPTGAATSAKQLADGHNVVVASGTVTAVTSITNAVAVTNAGITTIAAAVSTEMQCDIVGALPAGTALLGKVGIDQSTANANEVVLKTGSTTAVTSGTAANCKVEATVAAAQTIAVTNAGTFVVQENGAALTALQLIDNAISGAGFNITQVNGEAIDVGAGTEAAAIRVTLPTDGTGVVKLGAGTAEIGKLAAGTAEIGKLAAGTANIGDVDVLSFANGKTILRAVISGATSGDNTIIAADATKKIKVLSLFLVAVTAVTVRFESAAGGTALTGVMSIGATGGFVLPAPSDPNNYWFATAANELLNMELGGAVQVSGAITYYLEA